MHNARRSIIGRSEPTSQEEMLRVFFSSFFGSLFSWWGIFSSFFGSSFFSGRDYWKLQYNNRLWMVQIQESHFVAGHFHKAQWNVLSMNIKCKFPESNLWRSVKRYSTLGAFFFSDQLQKQRWKKPHFSITGSNKVQIYIKSWWLVYSRPALI